jgi:predicted O-methyltransferase YrrM
VARRSLLPEKLEGYVSALHPESDVARRLRAETAKLDRAGMQIGTDQAALLALLARSIGARRALEIGTFTGMSALAVAAALPEDGRLVACDVSEEWTSVARRYWREAGVEARIELRLGPALETLAALVREGRRASFDFAFIDADKEHYHGYYEGCLELLRPGGLLTIDNVLWSGAVADRRRRDATTRTIRELNAKISGDPRVEACLLTVADGVTLARKR